MCEFWFWLFEIFNLKLMFKWGGVIDIDFQDIYYYLKLIDYQGKMWDDVFVEIKDMFEKFGILEVECKYLVGVKVQFESEVVYGLLKEDFVKKGVIFMDMDIVVKEYFEFV